MSEVIPEAAVAAVARIVYRTSGRKRVMSYEEAREDCESQAMKLLEAAAPYMLAAAWDEGEEAGGLNHAAEEYPHLEQASNPYRPTRG